MGSCYLCRNNERISYLGYYCKSCKKIQDLISVYDNRVIEVLESVLTRTKQQANNKLNIEIKKEIDSKQNNLINDFKTKMKENTKN